MSDPQIPVECRDCPAENEVVKAVNALRAACAEKDAEIERLRENYETMLDANCEIIERAKGAEQVAISARWDATRHRERAEKAEAEVQRLRAEIERLKREGGISREAQDRIKGLVDERVTEFIGVDPCVDGAGCESGDPLDLTLSEITMGINAINNYVYDECDKMSLMELVERYRTNKAREEKAEAECAAKDAEIERLRGEVEASLGTCEGAGRYAREQQDRAEKAEGEVCGTCGHVKGWEEIMSREKDHIVADIDFLLKHPDLDMSERTIRRGERVFTLRIHRGNHDASAVVRSLKGELAKAEAAARDAVWECLKVEQVCGKALGYPLEPDGKTYCVGAHTPETVAMSVVRELEKRLTSPECVEAANADLARQIKTPFYCNKERVKVRLQAALAEARELK